jgi:hypothetical protein
MIADLGRYLHQPIDGVLEWPAEHVFLFHEQIVPILEAERPKKD